LRTILTFRCQSKRFGSFNLLASSILCRDMLLLILIYQPIYIKIARISFMHTYLNPNLDKVFNPNLVSHYFLAN
jgi:hypothetical protein